ncbi:bifunctional metallophosphatase/5'-nucleotidase [Neobacillus cucumis]|uniref:bifunctional metallophosphatase/5'-nucleotidase n=1 Tax=Neobacillus cucumis TaxID=1740721 RepID=UPI001965F205|nr:bifunctional UDP-sugar hydrolase/5'-nucleotidase [Neobacillus cucumis]MBM7651946.1 2',3'-cyclic-nucleotide 2'-phosphodiesterase (5'-nucleotidase family) [Neobacillus cucumis]
METIHIFHTNDFHSHLEHWPRIQEFLQRKKKQSQVQGEDLFLFDIGDFIDRWHPYTEATMGRGNITLLNQCGYNAVTIGNNEGVNLPHDDLDHLYDEAKFDVINANLYQKNGHYPDWVKPYKVYRTTEGTRIGVIGLTARFDHLYGLLGWGITEPLEELKKWLEPLKKEADVIILLSHLGIKDDEYIAEHFPDIDLILGAHTHHFLEKGKLVGRTLIGAAGKFGYFVGHMTLQVNEKKEIVHKEAILYDFQDIPPLENEQEQIQDFLEKGKELLNEKVTVLKEPLIHDFFHETNFSKLLCKALRNWCQTDCAMVNAGLLLGSLSGLVTTYDLLKICPHPINPCVVELTGEELEKILEETNGEELPHKEIKGLGFRGTVLGIFVYDGIQFRNNQLFVNNHPLEKNRTYTFALPDMFTFGHFFKEVLPQKHKKYFLPEFLRDLLKWELEKQQ